MVWTSQELASSEYLAMFRDAEGVHLSGTTVLGLDGGPARITYAVEADVDWLTRRVEVTVEGRRSMELAIDVADGVWTVNGTERPDLEGCTDVDLGWTPATNVLPIGRLGLSASKSAQVEAAWLRWPELSFERNEQRYTRLDASTWRYESGPFDFRLVVARCGLVTRYGDDLWVARFLDES